MKSEQQEAVQRRAYELWQAAGYPEGQALEHWLQAEREIGLPAEVRCRLELPIEPPVESDTPGDATQRVRVCRRAWGVRLTGLEVDRRDPEPRCEVIRSRTNRSMREARMESDGQKWLLPFMDARISPSERIAEACLTLSAPPRVGAHGTAGIQSCRMSSRNSVAAGRRPPEPPDPLQSSAALVEVKEKGRPGGWAAHNAR